MRIGVNAALIDGEFVDGDVAVESGRVAEVGLPVDGSGRIAAAGFVDLQVNGFAGADFATADVAGYGGAGRAMAATGVTSFQPTFITLPWDDYARAIAVAGEARGRTPGMVGLHLEGPFIPPQRCGAHDPANIVAPTAQRLESLISHDVVTWTTIAPEISGGVEAIRQFVLAGKTVAIGHSDATATVARAAFEAGARSVTHLFNAQSPLSHRAPGIPGVALDDDRVALSVIVDGHHLAPEVVRLVFSRAAGRVVLITDAIAATGRSPGETVLGDRSVTVANGEARLADGTLAGSVLTMDEAVRNVVDLGVSPQRALGAATANPARMLDSRIPQDLAPGSVADLVVLDSDFNVSRTLRGGEEVFAS
jgi:N-acetylglucosamine-6-phosphate deacetylase